MSVEFVGSLRCPERVLWFSPLTQKKKKKNSIWFDFLWFGLICGLLNQKGTMLNYIHWELNTVVIIIIIIIIIVIIIIIIICALHGRGLKVQRSRLRELMQQVDPSRKVRREWLRVRRRVYRVPGPNSLW